MRLVCTPGSGPRPGGGDHRIRGARPEILIPRPEAGSATAAAQDHSTGLEIGSLLRVIRQPYFGRIGKVVDLPPELQGLDTEAKVRVLAVEFADDQARAVVPRANVELIAG